MGLLTRELQIYLFFMAPAFWGVLAREKKVTCREWCPSHPHGWKLLLPILRAQGVSWRLDHPVVLYHEQGSACPFSWSSCKPGML